MKKNNWKAQGNYVGVIDENGNNLPIRITHVDGSYSNEQDVINARLIAAAPELLDACEAMFDYFKMKGEDNSILAISIKKAIKKAIK